MKGDGITQRIARRQNVFDKFGVIDGIVCLFDLRLWECWKIPSLGPRMNHPTMNLFLHCGIPEHITRDILRNKICSIRSQNPISRHGYPYGPANRINVCDCNPCIHGALTPCHKHGCVWLVDHSPNANRDPHMYSSHMLWGPNSFGALYIKTHTSLVPLKQNTYIKTCNTINHTLLITLKLQIPQSLSVTMRKSLLV